MSSFAQRFAKRSAVNENTRSDEPCWHVRATDDVACQLDVDPEVGLSAQLAPRRG